MVLKVNFKTTILLLISVYLFLQCTFFIKIPAFLIYTMMDTIIHGQLRSFSPYNLIPYYNTVFYVGLLLSGLLFVLAILPFVKRRANCRTLYSLPLTIIICPFYFGLLYLTFSGIKNIFQ